MNMALTNNDKQRIEQEAEKYCKGNVFYSPEEKVAHMVGAEYATIYERQQNGIPWIEIAADKEREIQKLLAERTELRNNIIDECAYALFRADNTAGSAVVKALKNQIAWKRLSRINYYAQHQKMELSICTSQPE